VIVAPPPPARSIVELAKQKSAELLVIGKHRKSFWRRLLFGSTCETIVRRAPCSVLVVPLAR
jgi:nucleotide-binding universal stress UspA family protein